jgi:hypothetical protein
MRGNRVQAIVRELSNERMDIINWTDELSLLVRRVFSPAEVKRVIPVGDKKIVVIIKEEDLAQAIGKEGQNIRLASKMLDREIDVYGDEEFSAFTEEQREQAMSEQGLVQEETADLAASAGGGGELLVANAAGDEEGGVAAERADIDMAGDGSVEADSTGEPEPAVQALVEDGIAQEATDEGETAPAGEKD